MELLRRSSLITPPIIVPNFFSKTDAIEKLIFKRNGGPALKLPIKNLKDPNLKDFDEIYEKLIIDSEKIFSYEDYDIIQEENLHDIKSNLHSSPGMFQFNNTNQKWLWFKKENIKDLSKNMHYPIFNKKIGFYPEIEKYFPNLIDLISRYCKKIKIEDPYKIFIFRVGTDINWHLDLDGYYSFRLFLSPMANWYFSFKKIKDDNALNEIRSYMNNFQNEKIKQELITKIEQNIVCNGQDIIVNKKELGSSFLLNNLEYVHKFSTDKPCYIVFVKGKY